MNKKYGMFLISITIMLLLLFSIMFLFSNMKSHIIKILTIPFFFFLLPIFFAFFQWRKDRSTALGIIVGTSIFLFLAKTMIAFHNHHLLYCDFHRYSNELVKNSNAIVKVKVLSKTGLDSIVVDSLNHSFKRRIAVVQNLYTLKGEAPKLFSIKYPLNSRDYSGLRKDVTAIIFLRKDEDGYRLLSECGSEILLSGKPTAYNLGDSSEEKILNEVLGDAANRNDWINAAWFLSPGGIEKLRILSKSSDTKVSVQAKEALIKMNYNFED